MGERAVHSHFRRRYAFTHTHHHAITHTHHHAITHTHHHTITHEHTGAGIEHSTRVRNRWLQDLFNEADVNGDGTLDLKEVVNMMRKLNVGISKKVLRQKFKVGCVCVCVCVQYSVVVLLWVAVGECVSYWYP